VEAIRDVFMKNVKKHTDFTIVPIQPGTHYFLMKNAEVIDLRDQKAKNSTISEFWFRDYVRPTMPSLADSLGATCSNEVLPIKYISERTGNQQKDIEVFKIDWSNSYYHVYPIPAKEMPSREDFHGLMYSMYKNQTLCDLSIVAKEKDKEVVLKVHSLPFYNYGGEMIQSLLTNGMKEGIEKKVHFEDLSINTLKAFIDFIYLGEDGLKPDNVQQSGVNLFELLQMAHTYQVPALVDCCTNLIALFASIEDLEIIKGFAKLYNNDHLRQLCAHLELSASHSDLENSPMVVSVEKKEELKEEEKDDVKVDEDLQNLILDVD